MRISKKHAFKLVKDLGVNPTAWTLTQTRVAGCDGSFSGSSEIHETYRHNGKPVLKIARECGSGKARAFDLRNILMAKHPRIVSR